MTLKLIAIFLTNFSIACGLCFWMRKKLKPLISNIKVDYSRGIGEAVQHIVSLGHQRVGLISGPLALKSARTRRSAFLKCIDACGIGERQRSVVEGNHKIDGER